MIAFASLFLGLVVGVRPVALVVGDGVAAIELRLDGERLGVLRQPPWTLDCDFGAALEPALLEAIAFDAGERELARVEQWINLPQPQAAISAVLEPRQGEQPRIARLSWESAAGAEPESVLVTLDGAPLAVGDPRRIVLPPVDERELHLLHVEMRFKDWVTSRADLTFGGAYADQVSTEMTALPIEALGSGRTALDVDGVQGWFVKDGAPLPVIAVERGAAEVVVVMGRPFPHLLEPGKRYKPPKNLSLPEDLRFRFLSPIPRQEQGVVTTFELFPISPAYGAETGDLYWLLSRLRNAAKDRPPRPSSAVAVAGLAAYGSRQRRAVVLLQAAGEQAESGLDPGHIRHYLESLRVPFLIWDPDSKPADGAWGTARPVGSLKLLAAALDELRERLDRQWIVWLDGQHLPQDIELAPAVEGFSFPGR